MFKPKSIRTKILIDNLLGSSLYKGINIVFSFLLVRYSIEFIGEEKYGIWLTLLSFFTWFSAFEVGITASLRNQLTEYFSEKNIKKIKTLIFKGYKALAFVYILLIISLIIISAFFPINQIFIPKGNNYENFNLAFQLSLVFYFLHFIFFYLNTIFLSFHNAKLTYLVTAIQNGILLLGVILFNYFHFSPSLILFCVWFSIIPLFIWIFFNVYSFNTSLSKYKPNFNKNIFEKSRPFKGINKAFFIIQICTLIIFTSDNIIIISEFSGQEVAKYNIAFKYFNILIVIFNIILLPYWASFTEAAYRNDKIWIQKNIAKLITIWIGITILSILMIIFSDFAYKLWIGRSLGISISLSIFMCLSALLTSWNNIFVYFLNSISKVNLQMKLLLISATLNVPLSIIFIKYIGSTGVILATCIALIPLSIALPIQYKNTIKRMN